MNDKIQNLIDKYEIDTIDKPNIAEEFEKDIMEIVILKRIELREDYKKYLKNIISYLEEQVYKKNKIIEELNKLREENE